MISWDIFMQNRHLGANDSMHWQQCQHLCQDTWHSTRSRNIRTTKDCGQSGLRDGSSFVSRGFWVDSNSTTLVRTRPRRRIRSNMRVEDTWTRHARVLRRCFISNSVLALFGQLSGFVKPLLIKTITTFVVGWPARFCCAEFIYQCSALGRRRKGLTGESHLCRAWLQGLLFSMGCLRVATYNVLSAREAYRLRDVSAEMTAHSIGLTGNTHGMDLQTGRAWHNMSATLRSDGDTANLAAFPCNAGQDKRREKREDEKEERRWKRRSKRRSRDQEKMKGDGDEREDERKDDFVWKMFQNPQTRQMNELKMFLKKSLSDELFLFFSSKVQNLTVFSIIYTIRIRCFGPRWINSEGVAGGTVTLLCPEKRHFQFFCTVPARGGSETATRFDFRFWNNILRQRAQFARAIWRDCRDGRGATPFPCSCFGLRQRFELPGQVLSRGSVLRPTRSAVKESVLDQFLSFASSVSSLLLPAKIVLLLRWACRGWSSGPKVSCNPQRPWPQHILRLGSWLRSVAHWLLHTEAASSEVKRLTCTPLFFFRCHSRQALTLDFTRIPGSQSAFERLNSLFLGNVSRQERTCCSQRILTATPWSCALRYVSHHAERQDLTVDCETKNVLFWVAGLFFFLLHSAGRHLRNDALPGSPGDPSRHTQDAAGHRIGTVVEKLITCGSTVEWALFSLEQPAGQLQEEHRSVDLGTSDDLVLSIRQVLYGDRDDDVGSSWGSTTSPAPRRHDEIGVAKSDQGSAKRKCMKVVADSTSRLLGRFGMWSSTTEWHNSWSTCCQGHSVWSHRGRE